jgi:Glycosyltransferase family 10 (fucosyltransferase) C-term
VKLCYSEEGDLDFIRWSSNLLRKFLDNGTITIVKQHQQPDMMLASVWRPHPFPAGVPVILVSNENWRVFPPHHALGSYNAVVGLYPPGAPCTFIQYPYVAVHFDARIEHLFELRKELLGVKKTKFCCFVTSNMVGELAAERVALFDVVNRWKTVDSAGRVSNNVGYLAPRGLDFLKWIADYKYMICLENSKEPGYITEKPFQPWFAGTVPIYDGGCAHELNGDAMVDASSGEALSQLRLLESRPDLYEAKRRAELYRGPITLEPFEKNFQALVLDGSVHLVGWRWLETQRVSLSGGT